MQSSTVTISTTLSLQVLIVTAGYSTVPLDTTEMLVGTGTWNIVSSASLPTGRWKPAAATVHNRVYLFGEIFLVDLHHYLQESLINENLLLIRRILFKTRNPDVEHHLGCLAKCRGSEGGEMVVRS